MFAEIIRTLLFFLPAYLANSSPVLLSKVPEKGILTPIDFGSKLRNHRIFGDGKTIVGFLLGVGVATIVGLLQNRPELGFLLGVGAMTGDLVNSFLKRRLGFIRGHDVPLLNQLDFIIGALLFSSLIIDWTLTEVVILLVLTPPLHRAANIFAHYVKLKVVPW